MTRKWRLALSLAALSWGSVATADDWPFFRHDLAGTSNPGELLTGAQAEGFHTAWTAPTPPIANPIVANGTVYVVDGDNLRLDALEAATGRLLWFRNMAVSEAVACVAKTVTLGPIGAPALVGSQLFMPGADGVVYSFDKDSGAILWQTPVADPTQDEFFWASAFPANGLIYLGVATYFEDACGEVPGRLVALDQSTGAVVATWWADANHGPGAAIWSRPAYDAESGKLFFATGTGVPLPTSANQPLGQAIVAVDPHTLATLDDFQVPGSYTEDFDFGAGPTLFDLANGQRLLAVTNKNGIVYAMNRDDLAAGPVWTYTVALAGASPDEGQGSIVSAAYANGTLFVGGGQTASGAPGSVVALDAATGAARWVFSADGFVLPALVAVGDVVIAAATNATSKTGTLYALSQSAGSVLYQQSTPSPIYAQPTYANGTLFFGDELGQLYALQPGSASDGGSPDAGSDAGQDDGPVAVITGGPFDGNAPLAVYLDATTSFTRDAGNWIQAFEWSFGDGQSSSAGYLIHTFAIPGRYLVTLTATDGHGRTASATQLVSAAGTPDAGTPDAGPPDAGAEGPVALITGGPFSGTAPLDVFLDATTSYETGGWIQAFHWDFGDGQSSTAGYQVHTFAAPGSYVVTLSATDGDGRTSSTTRAISASGVPDAGVVMPVAAITGGPFSGASPLAVYLDATTSYETDGWIQAFEWSFGDGQSSSAGYLIHTYAAPGTYDVTLKATDGEGRAATANQTIQVAP